jgi:hypothetical protein
MKSSNPSTASSWRILLVFAPTFCLIWLIPAGSLLSYYNPAGTLLGRYTPLYFAVLVVYGLAPVILIALAVLGRPHLREALLGPMRWLQRRPALTVVLLALSFVEIWYLVQRALLSLHLFTGGRFALAMGLVGLFALFAAGMLLLTDRPRADLGRAAANTLADLAGVALGFVLVALYYALLIGWQDYHPMHLQWADLQQPDPVLGYVPRPNQTGLRLYFEEEERYFPISTDASGFRNPGDVSQAVVAGLGDSILFGWAVADGELWSVPLSRDLGVPVANYGVPGYYFWQYNLAADRYMRQHDYRLVFYALDVTDLYVDTEIEENIDLLQRWQLWPWRSPVNYTLNALFGEPPLARTIRAVNMQLSDPAPTGDARIELYPDLTVGCSGKADELPDEVRELVALRLDRAMELADEIGYRLLFVLIPSKESAYHEQLSAVVGPDADRCINRERTGFTFICDYVEARGHHCYDMTQDFRAAIAQEGVLHFRVDGHWNPHGHEVFAHLLAQHIEEQGLLEDELSSGAAP